MEKYFGHIKVIISHKNTSKNGFLRLAYNYLWTFFGIITRFQEDGELKYLADAQELIRPERNTLTVNFADLEQHNQQLATTILEEYYRLYL